MKFRKFATAALTLGLMASSIGVAKADDISNNLDGTVDAAAETMALAVGGPNGSTTLRVVERISDGKNGCNLTGSTTLVVGVASSNTAVATVSPSSVTFTSCGTTQTLTVTAVGAGSSTISLSQTSNNTGGSFDLAPATFTVGVTAPDTTRPNLSTSHTANPAGWNSTSPVSVNVSANDTGSGLSSLTCTVDGLSAALSPPFATGSSYSGLLSVTGAGTHNVACEAKDAAGNTANASNTPGAADTVRIDLTDPALAVAHTANGAGWNTSAPVTVSVTASDGGSGLAAAPSCTVDGAAATLTDGTPGSWTLSVGSEGAHPVSCSVSDIAGRSANATDSVQVDTIAPSIIASAKTADGANYSGGWTNQTVTVHFTCSDAGSGIAAAACPDDVVVSTTTATAGQSVSDSVSDIAGNHASSNTIVVKVDKSGPGISHTLNPATADGSAGWYRGNVTLTWNVSEPDSPETLSKTGCVDQNVISDTNETFSCSASSAGGSSGPVDVTIKRDATAPTITASAKTADGATYSGGWTNQTVTVHFVCGDNLSGLASTCPADVVIDENTLATGTDVSRSVSDMAGNSQTSNIINVQVDKTAPTITASAKTADNATYSGGWTNQTVTVHFECSDGLSGIAAGACPAAVVISADTAIGGTNISRSVSDVAGNSETSDVINVKVDKTAPTITAIAKTADDATYSGGWTNQTVTVHFECSDGLSGIAAGACPTDVEISTNTPVDGTDVSRSVNDVAGNSQTSNIINVQVDKTAPTITASAKTADGATYSGGWTNQTVTVHFVCGDNLSGLASTCPADVVIDENTLATGTDVSRSVSDMAGNSQTSNIINVQVDKIAPTSITFIGGGLSDGGTYVFGSVPAGPTSCSATDALSGFAGCSLSPAVNGGAVGPHSIVATAIDNAGNQSTATLSYTVSAWRLNGFYQPVDMGGVVNTVKSGSTVPLKFEAFAGQTELTNTDIASWLVRPFACTSNSYEDAIELVATGGTSFRYDSTGGQFIYNWQTPKNKAGSCYEVTMTTTDGSSLVAKFKLK